MSLQWTLIATFLYSEIGIILILLMPFISPKRWQSLFKSKFSKAISSQGNIYFLVFIIILVLFFLDSIRDMYKYAATRASDADGHAHLDAEMQHNMKLFRAQRNFYIAGFALFLSFVIRRLMSLIITQATLLAQCEASMKQAQSATQVAENLMKDNDKKKKEEVESADNQGNAEREKFEKDIKKLEDELRAANLNKERALKDVDAIKKQAESLTQEYDRLMKEHTTLQKLTGSGSGIKKDD